MKKKLYCIILSLAMVVTMMPMATMTAFAETPVTVSTWEGLQEAINNASKGDTIKLGADIFAGSGDESISVDKELTLDLNGYMLNINYETYENSVSVIEVIEDGDLTIKDSPNTSATSHEIWCDRNLGYWTTYEPEEYDDTDPVNKHVTINGGLITGTYAYAAVFVDTGAQVTLQSGNIAGNVADYDGGGVFVAEGGKFVMNGGSISYNEGSYGGGVAVGSRSGSVDKAEFVLNGGTVSNNIAWTAGGGVYVSACPDEFEGPYFTMTGGTVSNNESYSYGGGVALEDCDAYTYSSTINAIIMKMTSGSITNNYCGTEGGGVFFDGAYEYGSVSLGGSAVISGNWCGDQLDPQPDDQEDNFHFANGNVDDSVGYLKFDENNAPTSGMNVGLTMATGTGDLTATLVSVPEGITNYLYSDSTDYMISTDNDKIGLKDNIYPILYCNDGTNARFRCEFGDNNVPKTNPTRENYAFDGWYTAKTDGTLVHDGTEFKNSYTSFANGTPYYAHWKDTPKTPTVYQMSATAPEYVLTGTPTAANEASFTISPKEIKEKGYSHVRVKVDVTKPEGSNPIIYRTSDSGKANVADGFIGAASGFAIEKDYNQTTALTMQFDKPGKYTITFSLIDLDNKNDVLCKAETSVTAQEHSTYKFDINEPDTWITSEEYSTGDVTLKYDKNNGLGYDKVCVKVEQTEKPDDSNAIIYDSTDNNKTNLLTSGYLGSSEGFELDKNYNNKTPLTMKFDKAGNYTFKFTLVDKNDSDKELCSATKTIVVSTKLDCKVNITGTDAQNYPLTVEVTDLPAGVDVTYQWYRCEKADEVGTLINGATKETYKATVNDVGYLLKCRVSATAGSGYGGYVEGITSAAIKPAFTGKPSITVGQKNEYAPRTGEQIIASIANTGDVDHNNVTFQWYRCDTAGSKGTKINGATSDRYTPIEDDLGKYLRVEITAKDSCRFGGSAMSDPTAKVKNPPSITDAPEVTATSIKLPTSGKNPNTFEYSKNGTDWNDTYEFTGLTPETKYTYYIREKGPQGEPPTASTEVQVYTAFATPQKGEGYKIDYKNEKITITSGYEISTNSDEFGDDYFDKYKMTPDENGYVQITPGKSYYVRKAAVDGGAPASAALYLIETVLPSAPDSPPELKKKTANTISVIALEGQEYSINGGETWVTDNGKGDADSTPGLIKFSGLTAETTYNIITRMAAGSEAFAGNYSERLIETTEASYGPSPSPETVDSDDDNKVIVSGDTAAVDVSDKNSVLLTVDKLNELVENEAIEQLVVKTKVAQFTFDKTATDAILDQVGDGEMITVEAIRQDEESKKAALDMYELKVIAIGKGGMRVIGEFAGGKVTVRVAIPEGLVGQKLGCLYKNDKGVYSRKTIVKQDNENGYFDFTTTHFSSYVVAKASVATKLLVNQTSVTQNKLKSTKKKQVKVSFKKATWDKELNKKVVRYQVYRSTKSNKGFKKVATLKNQKKSTITYVNKKGLKSGKKYYYKVRGMVKLANGKYVYTKWSKVKSIKCA